MKSTRELGREAAAAGTALITAIALAGCGLASNDEPSHNAWDVMPTFAGPPSYPGNGTRILNLASPRRHKFGTHEVTESCNDGNILRYDSEIQFLDRVGGYFQSYVPPVQKIAGPQVEAACADNTLEPGDPVAPVADLPN